MKIKAVSEITGLSDRTIRYYFEQRLISPQYSENYLGRKSFDFSQSDIDLLNDIAILRRFDFTIDEIREIINDANASTSIICSVKHRTEKIVANGEERLLALSKLNTERAYTLGQLAKELSTSDPLFPKHKETIKADFPKTILTVLKTSIRFIIVWAPIVITIYSFFTEVIEFRYPLFDPIMIIFAVLALRPSIAVLIISKIKAKWKTIAIRILLILCVLSIPYSAILPWGIVDHSATTDIRNYRDFDAECLANRDIVFQELFPNWPHYIQKVENSNGTLKTENPDAHYYYFFEQFSHTYDIYAEWPLEANDYNREVLRATDVFNKAVGNNTHSNKFAELKKGDYTCLILYAGDEPFQKTAHSYSYLIFAYNDKEKTVRYISCDSLEISTHQPYYLSLDW